MKMILAGLTLLFAACAQPQAEVQVQPLVDADWLSEHLDDVVVLDVRSDGGAGNTDTYATGHIAGSIHSAYGQSPWRVTRDSVPGMLPPMASLERLIGGLGISNDDYVVIVPAGTSALEVGSATRVYWQFKVLGHEKVAILDGGYAAWKAAGYPSDTDPVILDSVIYLGTYQPQLVATKEDVLLALEVGTPLIDARSASYYSGASQSRLTARAGTIHGAVNVPATHMTVDSTGTFVDARTAGSFWAAAGVPADGEQIVFCNIGHMASLTWYAAYELLGNKEAKMYDGSMAEWSADPELPMDNSGGTGSS
ncbi:MAG: hypothetical protein AMS21_12130 [Gemmatimonas sp. SG8_38_2]|nr:MAG: hypothetical protein AMS21_12130 [Gemmatimonas sp. SG8_38_2]